MSRWLPRNGFPTIEGLGVHVEWDSPGRMKRTHRSERWAWWFDAKVRRNRTDAGLFLRPFWNPYVNVRVIGLFVGAGICVSWPERELIKEDR